MAEMQAVMQAVSQALQYDDNNNNQAAYIAYLHCVQQVSHILLQDASKAVRVTPLSSKCIQLGQHCMERICKLHDGLPQGPEKDVSKEPPRIYSPTQPTSSVDIPKQMVDDRSNVKGPPVNLPELPSPDTLMQSYLKRSNEQSPMEMALRKNQQLMVAYKNRMQRMSSKSHCATNMSLSIQRRMAENVAIAKAREQALVKKLQERQQRLEAEAARRFASTTGMSKDEQERRHIYSQVLIYEADVKPLLQCRERLAQNPEDPKLIQDIIRYILSNGDHPLTQLLVKLQYSIYDKVRPVVRSYYHELSRVTVPYVPSPTDVSSSSRKESSPSGSDEGLVKAPTASIQSTITNSPVEENLKNNDQRSPSTPLGYKTFPEACAENRQEIESALVENSKLSIKLRSENKKAEDILKGLDDTQQFDDLFDEDDEDDKRESSQSGGAIISASEIDIVKDLADISEAEKLNCLKKEALMRHRDDITHDIKTALEKLMSMFTVAYEQLDSAAGRDICWSSLEEPFFKPLWPYILTLFRLASYDLEVKAAKAMTDMMEITPRDLGIKEKYYSKTGDALPFHTSMDELRNLTTLVCPLSKLECTVRTCRQIIQSMEENIHEGSSDMPAMGADDLLPVLAYVIIHCRLPELVAECNAMEEFIHEGYLMGEEGYCLTSLQTALNYVMSGVNNPLNND